MTIHKCNKYIAKLKNTSIDDEKFGIYLAKLNYWYIQTGGLFGWESYNRNRDKACTNLHYCRYANEYNIKYKCVPASFARKDEIKECLAVNDIK